MACAQIKVKRSLKDCQKMAEMEETELQSINGLWICRSCLSALSTKRLLKAHISKFHSDNEYSVSLSSKRRKVGDDDVDTARDTASVSPSVIAYVNENDDSEESDDTDDLRLCFETEQQPKLNVNSLSHTICVSALDETVNNTADDSTYASSEESIALSSSDEYLVESDDIGFESGQSDSEPYESSDEENDPIYPGAKVTQRDHAAMILAYGVRHNMNLTQITDLLELIKLHCPPGCTSATSMKSVRQILAGDIEVIYHDMCDVCYSVFPVDDPTVTRCATETCYG